MKYNLYLVCSSVLTLLSAGLAAAPAIGVPANSHAHREVTDNRAGSPAALRDAPLPASAVALLEPVALASADGAAALAADDLLGYKKNLQSVRNALVAFFDGYAQAEQGPLADYPNGLTVPEDLTTARHQFEPFSTAVADVAQRAGLHESAKLHVFQCSMSPVLGRGRWLQRSSGAKNPFFGARMLGCGTEIAGPSPKRSATEIALPPGHPPLDAATIAAFTGRQPGTTATSDGACGSCGMSKAAMAAGEPCGDAKK